MARSKASVTGVTGKDGIHLTEMLSENDSEVRRTMRRMSSFHIDNVGYISQNPQQGTVLQTRGESSRQRFGEYHDHARGLR